MTERFEQPTEVPGIAGQHGIRIAVVSRQRDGRIDHIRGSGSPTQFACSNGDLVE